MRRVIFAAGLLTAALSGCSKEAPEVPESFVSMDIEGVWEKSYKEQNGSMIAEFHFGDSTFKAWLHPSQKQNSWVEGSYKTVSPQLVKLYEGLRCVGVYQLRDGELILQSHVNHYWLPDTLRRLHEKQY